MSEDSNQGAMQIVTPYLIIKGAEEAIEFYKKAFGAVEIMRMKQPDGRIGHAELKINGGAIMLADEFPEMGIVSPTTLGGSAVALHVYVQDVDLLAAQSAAAGAEVIEPLKDQFYGDRNVKLKDPFGHTWMMATHIEDVSPEEMQRRFEAMSKSA